MDATGQNGTGSPPERIAKYVILDRLGTGGMAEVFLAHTTGEGGFEKRVAIKRILPSLADDETFVRMFIDEARIAASLAHGNIAQIFELGKADGSYFIAMEHVEGVSLSAILKRCKDQDPAFRPSLAAYLTSNICAALAYAHDKRDSTGRPLKIIHRDVSPGNVLVSFEGEVKLIDFGIAKAARRLVETRVGYLKGKLDYLSPEQVSGVVDHRSDIFSAGVVLYEVLAGKPPFRGGSNIDTLERIRRAVVPDLSTAGLRVPEPLVRICHRALARDPDRRFQSAGEMERAVEAFLQNHPFTRRQLADWLKQTFSDRLALARGPEAQDDGVDPLAITTRRFDLDWVGDTEPFDRSEALDREPAPGPEHTAMVDVEEIRQTSPGGDVPPAVTGPPDPLLSAPTQVKPLPERSTRSSRSIRRRRLINLLAAAVIVCVGVVTFLLIQWPGPAPRTGQLATRPHPGTVKPAQKPGVPTARPGPDAAAKAPDARSARAPLRRADQPRNARTPDARTPDARTPDARTPDALGHARPPDLSTPSARQPRNGRRPRRKSKPPHTGKRTPARRQPRPERPPPSKSTPKPKGSPIPFEKL